MKLGCFPIGCSCAKYLPKLLCRLLACRPLDAVDLGFALPRFAVNGEFYFRHLSLLGSEFHSDLDRLSDSLFDESAAEFLSHLSSRCFVIAVLKPDHEIFPKTVRKI